MRFLAVMLAAFMLASVQPAWAWLDGRPGDQYWPPIPGNAGMDFFLGTWKPDCNNGTWISFVDEAHGPMTLHPDGRISYRMRNPTMPTRYRLIEETPNYVVLMTHEDPWKQYGEILRFWILRRLEAWTDKIGLNVCRPNEKDLKGFDWAGSDDDALRRTWRESASCNPDRMFKSLPGSYLGDGWDQECKFFRPGHWHDDDPNE